MKPKRRISAKLLKVGLNRVKFDEEKLSEIKEAITKADVRSLIQGGLIKSKKVKGVSKSRARKIKVQKRKGRRQGKGGRKGKRTARLPRKESWMLKIRAQRDFIKNLRDKKLISTSDYRDTYRKAKGGYFRSKRHIKMYLEEQGIFKKK